MRIRLLAVGTLVLLTLLLFSVPHNGVLSLVLRAAPGQPADLAPLQDVAQLAAGGYHTCVRTNGGGVKCWGANDYGQLGDNTNTSRNLPVDVLGLSSGVTAVAAGTNHTCALLSSGGVKCWGKNEFGQLGDGTTQNRRLPAIVQGLSSGIIALAAGDHHTCAQRADGVQCWGRNDHGQLGDTTQMQRSTPVAVSGLASGVTTVAAGGNHTCAIVNGAVLCWGRNVTGQIGDGTNLDQAQPTAVSGLSSGASALTAGSEHTCAVVNGGARCWGANYDGQLGDDGDSESNTPVNVFNLSSGVTAMTAGEKHTCAWLSSGGVKCWGRNAYGQVGDSSINYVTMPVDVVGLASGVVEVAAGNRHTCARMGSGEIKCWGLGDGGQLGDGVSHLYSTPVAVTGLSTGVSALGLGGVHSCALVNGAAQCWGANDYLQLGNDIFGASPLPVAVALTGDTLTDLTAGDDHTCVRTSNGGIKCWGGNYWGQLGLGNSDYTNQIVDVIGLTTGVITFTTGYNHTCAVVTGQVKCWGYNGYGELGTGDTTNSATPVDVVGLQTDEVVALAGGGYHTCALTNSGGVKCWGLNREGELGAGFSTISETTPINVSGLVSNVVGLAAGVYHTCALLTNGGVKCWGVNDYGQLGDNTTSGRHAPVNVTGLSSGVKALVAGHFYSCALLNSGEIKCWGENWAGQLGDGTYSNRRAPTNVTGLAGSAHSIAAGSAHTCAVLSQGGVRCWGNGAYGQLGNGHLAWRYTPATVLVPGSATNPTFTPTPTATNSSGTPASTATPTVTLAPGAGDAYENDDGCAHAHAITSDGAVQTHSFHTPGDVDWVQFTATAAVTYVVEARVPAASGADLILEIHSNCTSGAQQSQDYTFSPDVRLQFVAPSNGPLFLRLLNADPTKAGSQVVYQLSVRVLATTPAVGAVIIVAGRYKPNDPLQPNIHALTKRAYQLWRTHGYPPERIRYLASDLGLDADNDGQADVAGLANRANLQAAITEWAVDKVGPDRALTIYLMDHGGYDKFYLDGPRNEILRPEDLNGWLAQLEATLPGLSINIIIEACYAGSFIDAGQSISGANRVVVASTGAYALAWASRQGAVFSDTFFDSLAQGQSLSVAFAEARDGALSRNSAQAAWLDDNGDGIPNGDGDGQIAVQRGFGFAGSFPTDNIWPPYVVWAEVRNDTNARKELWAEVRDNENAVRTVWAVIYPPSYQAPSTSEELVAEPLPLPLLARGNDQYAATYGQFDEPGTYRIVIYAEDDEGLTARPVELIVSTLYLPLIRR